MINKLHNANRNAIGVFLGTMAIALGLSGQAHAFRYGAMCNDGYMANPTGALNMDGKVDWQTIQPGGPAACNAFLQGMSPSSNSWRFNWRTTNGEVHAFQSQWPRWESDYIESVDFMFYLGHGGAFTETDWFTAGSPYNELVGTSSMCFGSTPPGQTQAVGQRGLSVLSINSCYTLTPQATVAVQKPGGARGETIQVEPPILASGSQPRIDFPQRPFIDATVGTMKGHWAHAMSCGLRMVNGTWHQMMSNSADVQARNFTSYLNQGRTFEAAWEQSVKDQDLPNAAPATMAHGLDVTDCLDNLHNLKLSNVNAKGRVTTTGTLCMSASW